VKVKEEPDEYLGLCEKNELDEFIRRSSKYLEKYPNNMNSLYFGAQALIGKKQFEDARKHLNRIIGIDLLIADIAREFLKKIEEQDHI